MAVAARCGFVEGGHFAAGVIAMRNFVNAVDCVAGAGRVVDAADGGVRRRD